MKKILTKSRNITCLFKLLVAGCSFGQGHWSFLVEKDVEISNDLRFSAEPFEKDKTMGVEFLADPQSIRQVGARQFHLWHNLPAGNSFYLRVARDSLELSEENFDREKLIFSDLDWRIIDGIEDDAKAISGLSSIDDPVAVNTTLRTHEYNSWDFIYQNTVQRDGYFSVRANKIRRYLLQRRYGINALIKTPWAADGLLDPHNASLFTVEADTSKLGQAIGFVFDSDPFGFGHTRPQNQRLAANLSGRNGRVYYQWVRVDGDEYFYGDIHECILPRAAYVGVIGDSYTSGEGAPFTEGSASAFGIGNWITSYVDSEHSAHRSYSSGWQKAVNQHVRQAFTTTSIDFIDVSRSGAQARWKDCNTDSFIDEDRLSLIGTDVSGGQLRTAARQKLLINDILERDSQQKLDILGFTFGGNDAYFSKIISAMLLLDYDDGDYNLSNIGSIPDSDYPNIYVPFVGRVGPTSPFPYCAPSDFNDMIYMARWQVSDIRRNDHGFDIGYQLRGNYCNPVGAMRTYSPDAVPGEGVIAQLDRDETNLIRSTIMPKFNDELVDDQLLSITNGRVVDTRLPTPESEGLPHDHPHHILSTDEWFNEILTRDEDNNRFNYAFHPNARGYDNIYRPIYYYQLKEELKASRRRQIYESEAEDADLVNLGTGLRYDGGNMLGVEFAAKNQGGMASEPSLLNMRVEFGPRYRQRFSGGWILGSRSSAFETPLRDIDNNLIIIDSLAPDEATWQYVELEKGELECVYYNLIINHFLQISDTELIRETIGNYSPEQLHARFAAFLPLFGQDGVSISFNFTPVSRREINMQNNRSRSSGLPFEVNLENLFGWAAKTRDKVYKELFDKISARGIKLENTGSYSMEDLYGNPSNLEKDFDVTTLDQGIFDRDAVESDSIFDASLFGKIYEQVDTALNLGLLAPKPIFIDPYLLKDYLVVKTPVGEKKIPFQRWYEVEDVLPKDGGSLQVIYCRAERNDDPTVTIKYTDIPIKVKTKHSFDGLKNFYENKVLNNGTLALEVDFAERSTLADQKAFSRVVVRDTLSGAIFYDRYHTREMKVNDFDLTNILFHSANVSVEISTDAELTSSFYKIGHGNESSVTQNNLSRSGAFVEFELIMRGSAAASFSNSLEIVIPKNFANQKEFTAYLAKLVVVSAENAEEDNQKVKVVTVKMPLDLVYNEVKIVKIIDRDDSQNSFLSSIDTRSLHDLLPLGGISHVEAIPVGIDPLNLNAILTEPASGMIVVDKSDDMKNWSRVYSGIASDGDERAIELQFNNPKKGFVRARRFILSEK
ncbi:hypothetical protein N8491_03495 [Akkermansiaceae bacterium]|nr:hypothetical protein [Akkermansiaceae bacterium]